MELDTTIYGAQSASDVYKLEVLPLPHALASPAMEHEERAFAVDLSDTTQEGGLDPTVGTVTWHTMISNDRTPSRDMILGIANFPPNGTLNPHRHEPPEFYLGLDGDGVVTIDGVAHTISKNKAVYIPSNTEHGVIAGPKGLSMAYGFARAAFADIEYVFSNCGANDTTHQYVDQEATAA